MIKRHPVPPHRLTSLPRHCKYKNQRRCSIHAYQCQKPTSKPAPSACAWSSWKTITRIRWWWQIRTGSWRGRCRICWWRRRRVIFMIGRVLRWIWVRGLCRRCRGIGQSSTAPPSKEKTPSSPIISSSNLTNIRSIRRAHSKDLPPPRIKWTHHASRPDTISGWLTRTRKSISNKLNSWDISMRCTAKCKRFVTLSEPSISSIPLVNSEHFQSWIKWNAEQAFE